MTTMKLYEFDPRKLPLELLAAIGLATSSAAQTENIIEQGIAGCSGLSFEYGAAITTHMVMPLRFSVLRSVAEIRIDDLDSLDELDQLLDDIEKAFNKRNEFAHHQWCTDSTNNIFTLKTSSRVRLDMDLVPRTINDVKSAALLVYETGVALYAFLAKHDLLPTIPSQVRSRSHKSKAARKKRRERK